MFGIILIVLVLWLCCVFFEVVDFVKMCEEEVVCVVVGEIVKKIDMFIMFFVCNLK